MLHQNTSGVQISLDEFVQEELISELLHETVKTVPTSRPLLTTVGPKI